ncbi:hypothetical protein DdX_19903 [Ditylenchus destructor]|uniref:Uncharacterized protein n=1 Tax=Ditylenchus destructor TaxID=166010 RepID=A0AAD4QWQ6_9BILA|nr:hypothetical protein DdX_19903 [Ditylenchus destructor]
MGNALGSPRPCSECFRKLTTNRRKQRLTRLEDVLIFFDRSDLERISLSSRQLRHIVVNYFYDSPYLLLDNACVMIIHKSFALLKFRGIHYGEYFHQHTLNWIVLPDNSDWPQIEQEHLINIKDMYFPKWFRVDLAQIECSIFAEKPTEDAMDAYELICHIWTGQTLRIFSRTTYQDDIMNLRVRLAIDMLLSNSNLLRVCELQYRAWDYVQQVYNYPLVYEANIVRVEATRRWNSRAYGESD